MINLEAFIPAGHVVRRIDRVLDLSFLNQITADLYDSSNGRPSIDPELFFRMQILKTLQGIGSDRKLCSEIQVNLAYRWFCQLSIEDTIPHHSSMTRIRDRLGEEVFCFVFEQILEQCHGAGLVPGEKVLVDATHIEANASIGSMEEREESDTKPLEPRFERYHDFREGKKKRKLSNKTHVSTTDPDSTMVTHRRLVSRLAHKVHYTADAYKRVILDCHVTTGARHAGQILPIRLQHLLDHLSLPLSQVTADKAYGRGPTYGFLKRNKIRPYIPLLKNDLSIKKYSSKEFRYNKDQDQFTCPAGHILLPYQEPSDGLRRFRIVGGHCKYCQRRDQCLPEGYKHRARFIYFHPHQKEIDNVRRRMKTAYFKKKLTERSWKIEGLFAEAKENHGLRRAHLRGRAKVQIQVYLIAMVQNLKRLATSYLFALCWVLFQVKLALQTSLKWVVGKELRHTQKIQI
ncbi:MAG: IS1182 family transposase [SAR324 cluster bacterium]|nr:IS1182 family transposase [SAR324 cluster bacterium]